MSVPTCKFIRSICQSRQVCKSSRHEVRFFLSTRQPLTSILEFGESGVATSDRHWFAEAVQVLSCKLCWQNDSVNSGIYRQGSSLSASGAQELWPVNNTFNSMLITGKRGWPYLFVPKRVQTKVEVALNKWWILWFSGVTLKVDTYLKYCEHYLWFFTVKLQ